jgi:hypothetical protein
MIFGITDSEYKDQVEIEFEGDVLCFTLDLNESDVVVIGDVVLEVGFLVSVQADEEFWDDDGSELLFHESASTRY